MNDNRINYTQVVWEITCLLQEADSLEDALRTSLESVVKAVDAEAGTIWFYNSKGDKRIYPSFWIGGADLTGLSLECGEGIAGTVVKDAKTTVVKDCQQDARWAGRFDKATGFVTRSMICVPLTNKYETIGCIQIINKKDGSLYTDDDVSLCENLAMLSAIAIDNKGLNLGFTEEKKAIVSLREVNKTVNVAGNETKLLRDVSFDVLEGELLVVLGKSGSGKRELFDILLCMDKPTSGSFSFDEKELADADANLLTSYRRSVIGAVLAGDCLIPTLTLEKNLAFVAGLVKKPMDIKTALGCVGLEECAQKRPDELSGAQRRLAAIACALVKNPKLILVDEPTADIDCENGRSVLSALEKIRKENTVVVVTHNEEIAKLGDRIIRMKAGAVAEIVVNAHPALAKELVW